MIVSCPHCNQMIEILELRCRIFRCGIYKSTYKQINPHLAKEFCLQLVLKDEIYGCGGPFLINNLLNTEKCDYI